MNEKDKVMALGKSAQCGRALAVKHEELTSDPQHPHKTWLKEVRVGQRHGDI